MKKSFTGNFCGKWKLKKAAKTMMLREEFSLGIPYKYEEALKLAGEYQRIFEEEAKSLQAKKYMELSLSIPCIRFILFMNSVTCGKWYRL